MHPDRRDYSEVKTLLTETLAEQRELGDVKAQAASLTLLAFCLHLEGRFTDAVPHFEESIALRRRINDKSGEIETLPMLAASIARLGRARDAVELLQQALAIQSGHGNPSHTVFTLSGVAGSRSYLGTIARRCCCTAPAARSPMNWGSQGQPWPWRASWPKRRPRGSPSARTRAPSKPRAGRCR